jgi:hypothetical protein
MNEYGNSTKSEVKMSTESSPTRDPAAVRRGRTERRKEYLRQYYLANRDRAREYQRQYSQRYRRKQRFDDEPVREEVRSTYTVRDIMQLPTEKAVRAINLICRGERAFTM